MTIFLNAFRSIKNLPSLPEQINSVLVATGSTSSMDYNIVEIIQYDPSMAMSVLKVANSPVYGFSKKISSLQQAAGLLGPGAIKNIILRIPILERYSSDHPKEISIRYEDLWLQSGVTASISGGLGRMIGRLESDVCFTAGLIHNAGIIALSAVFPHELAQAFETSCKEKINLLDAEKKVFGFTNLEVGRELMTSWNFPNSLLDLFQPDPDRSKPVAVVALAKRLAKQWGYPGCSDIQVEPDQEILLKSLEITSEDLSRWEPELRKYADLAKSVLNGSN
ncbi:MAG: HDOD domain-containing protein [Nitrospinota bacterium]